MRCIRDDHVGAYDQPLAYLNYRAVVAISQREDGLHTEWRAIVNVEGIDAGIGLRRQQKVLGPVRSIDSQCSSLVAAEYRYETDDSCLNQG